mgnify:FL=1
MLRYLVISLVSILFSIYLFESYILFKDHLSTDQISKNQVLKEQIYKKNTGKNWDNRTRFQIYENKKKINNDIVIRFQPSYFLNKQNLSIFPLSGISNSETIHCNENGYFSIYQSDRHGFNNPDEEWNNKEIEYLLVGDSFTHGSCVNRPNDIASVLRTLSSKSTLNLGYGGNGPLIEYATLREYVTPNVKNILWVYCESNDLFELVIERQNKYLLKYLNSENHSQNLRNKQKEVDELLNINFEKELQNQIKKETFKSEEQLSKNNKLKYKILKFIRLDKTKKIFKKKDTKYNDIIFDEFEKILQRSLNLSETNNAKLIFVYIPEYRRYNSSNYSDENYNKITSIVKKLNIDLVDMRKVFDNENNPKIFFPFQQFAWHYNEDGYKKVAETIYNLTKG